MYTDFGQQWIDAHAGELIAMSAEIWKNPETAFKETKALELQTALLKKFGFEPESQVCGLQTSYSCSYGSGHPCVAFAAEYDALPDIGHACGHNLICMSAIAAFAALADHMKKNNIPGKIVLLGTPGEESAGGKVIMLENHCLDDVDIVLTTHPSFRTIQDTGSTGIRRFTVEFKGHAAHAAAAPELGLNALDAVLLLFNGVNAWRQQLPENTRIHGIVLNGGVAPNIIPEFASCRFFLRSTDEAWLDKMESRFKDMVKGAELMSGTTAAVTPFRTPYQSRKVNEMLNGRFFNYAMQAGLKPTIPDSRAKGSSDFGNFSRKRPGIHPYFAISEKGPIAAHSVEFREAANSEFAYRNALTAASVIASIALDCLTDAEFRKEVQQDFDRN